MNKSDFELFQEFMAFKEANETKETTSKKHNKKKPKYTQRKDGYYCTQVSVGFEEETGKRIRKTLYAKTIAELDDKVTQIKMDVMSGKKMHFKKITFGHYAKKWLEQRKPFLEYKTYEMYESIIRLYGISIDDIELKDITRSDIQIIINNNGDKPRTCQQIRMTFKQIFDYALDDDLIYKNPVRNIEMPKYDKPVKRALTKEEDLLSDIADFTDREKAFIMLIKWNGLRREEALALDRNDFDFKNNTLTIDKALIFIDNKPVIKSTKSNSSNRVLPLLDHVAKFMKIYFNTLSTDQLFTLINKEALITQQSFKRMWESIISKMDSKGKEIYKDKHHEITGLTPHIFRHNYASMLYQIGVNPKEAQYLLGHSSINMTMDVYTHIDIANLAVTSLMDERCSKNAVEVDSNIKKSP